MNIIAPRSIVDSPSRPAASNERGIALIVIMLLMAVLSALATGFAMTGQVEVQMGHNEVYYAGARAAAEAGMNRCIIKVLADTTHNLLAGPDGSVDTTNANAAVNTDKGNISYLIGSGPFYVDSNNQYSYTATIVDDDDPSIYQASLTSTQLTQMAEDGNKNSNLNDRLILKVVGTGPNGTTVTLERILETVDTVNITTTTTTSLSNPAILVNGNLSMNGNPSVAGTAGSVHANGNISIAGHVSIAHASRRLAPLRRSAAARSAACTPAASRSLTFPTCTPPITSRTRITN